MIVGNAPFSHAVSCEQTIFLLPIVVLHYTIFSVVYQSCLEFHVETTGEVSLVCSFSKKTALMSTVSLHKLHIDLLKLYILTCRSYILPTGIFILILLFWS